MRFFCTIIYIVISLNISAQNKFNDNILGDWKITDFTINDRLIKNKFIRFTNDSFFLYNDSTLLMDYSGEWEFVDTTDLIFFFNDGIYEDRYSIWFRWWVQCSNRELILFGHVQPHGDDVKLSLIKE